MSYTHAHSFLLAFIAQPDVIWLGLSLWLVCICCPGCVLTSCPSSPYWPSFLPLFFFNSLLLKGFYIVIPKLQQIGSGKYCPKAFPTFCKNFILNSVVIDHWPLCIFIALLQTMQQNQLSGAPFPSFGPELPVTATQEAKEKLTLICSAQKAR